MEAVLLIEVEIPSSRGLVEIELDEAECHQLNLIEKKIGRFMPWTIVSNKVEKSL